MYLRSSPVLVVSRPLTSTLALAGTRMCSRAALPDAVVSITHLSNRPGWTGKSNMCHVFGVLAFAVSRASSGRGSHGAAIVAYATPYSARKTRSAVPHRNEAATKQARPLNNDRPTITGTTTGQAAGFVADAWAGSTPARVACIRLRLGCQRCQPNDDKK